MNAHVGQRRDGFEKEMGYFGLGGVKVVVVLGERVIQ